jgi:hypothetical protein
MSELSPAADAVLDAYMDNCGWLDGPLQRDYQCVAAVLRAAADQVVPANVDYFKSLNIRRNLLAIATELEAIDEEDALVITVELEAQ